MVIWDPDEDEIVVCELWDIETDTMFSSDLGEADGCR